MLLQKSELINSILENLRRGREHRWERMRTIRQRKRLKRQTGRGRSGRVETADKRRLNWQRKRLQSRSGR